MPIPINPNTIIKSGKVTIGRIRDDGDLDVFATLNNENAEMPEVIFNQVILSVYAACLTQHPDTIVLERDDAPDVVEVKE